MIINPNWIEIQTGLYLEQNSFTVSGTTYYNSILHSGDGYCFYDADEEIYDEDGNLIPPDEIHPNQRTYAQFCVTPITDIDELTAKFISVPVQAGFQNINENNEDVELENRRGVDN